MRWIWAGWLLAIVATFTVLEGYALSYDTTTLSRFVRELSKAWPPLPWVIGNITGGLAVHFWWHWDPERKEDESNCEHGASLCGDCEHCPCKGWLAPEQASPVTDLVINVGAAVLAALPAVYAAFKVDNGPKK